MSLFGLALAIVSAIVGYLLGREHGRVATERELVGPFMADAVTDVYGPIDETDQAGA